MRLAGRRPKELLLAVVAAGAILFGLVAADVVANGLLAHLDPHVARWSMEHARGDVHTVLQRTTQLGDSRVLTAIVLLGMAWLVQRRRLLDAIVLGVGAGTVGLLTIGLKQAFRRSRPPFVDPSSVPHSFSFPSGHASGAFTVYVLLAFLLTTGLQRRVRIGTVGCALGIAVIVGATRVLLPVHYLTDVIAGASLGLAVAAGALLARREVATGR